jgi:cbb3-type cytochrome oxidase subunit 1
MSDIDPQQPATPDEVPTSNPLEGLDVNVSMPTLEVRMVNAGALEEYEIWFGWSSALIAAVVGFGVAFIQSLSTASTDWTFLAVTVVFGALVAAAVLRTIKLRKRIAEESDTYPMRLTGGGA